MKKITRYFVSLVTCLVLFSLASMPVIHAMTTGEQKLLARRSALVDAYSNLAEGIKRLPIASDALVSDFIEESDEIQVEFYSFIKEAKMIGKPVYFDDGGCKVTVQISLQQIVAGLKRIQMKFHHLGHIHAYNFDHMAHVISDKEMEATGHGVVEEEPDPLGFLPPPEPIVSPQAGIPSWEGVMHRGKLAAERIAKENAYMNLNEAVKDLRIFGTTYVRDFVAESEVISARLDAYLHQMGRIGPYRYFPGGVVEGEVQIALKAVIKELKSIFGWYVHFHGSFSNPEVEKIRFDDIHKWYRERDITATGEGTVPEKYRAK